MSGEETCRVLYRGGTPNLVWERYVYFTLGPLQQLLNQLRSLQCLPSNTATCHLYTNESMSKPSMASHRINSKLWSHVTGPHLDLFGLHSYYYYSQRFSNFFFTKSIIWNTFYQYKHTYAQKALKQKFQKMIQVGLLWYFLFYYCLKMLVVIYS